MDTTSAGPSAPAETAPGDDTEVELKLTADEPALKSIMAAAAITARAVGKPRTRQLESVYYDTPDLRLKRRRIALRVRRSGRSWIQTLKTDGDGVTRDEWEAPVAGAQPDLGAIAAPEARARLGLILPEELTAVFATRVTRRTRVIEIGGESADRPRTVNGTGTADASMAGGGMADGVAANGGAAEAASAAVPAARIEVAFDVGRVVAGEKEAPVAEIELELIHGPSSALWRLARELHDIAPLHVERSSKAARGYRLAGDAGPDWHKAGKLALDPGASVDDALTAILKHCFGHWMANEEAARDGSHPEGVHQMRVALRRLRSALTLYEPVLPAGRLAHLKAELKWVAGGLGPARDWDVFLDELVGPLDEPLPDEAPALAAVRDAAAGARAAGYERARAVIAEPRYTALVLELGEWIEGRGWRDDLARAADAESLAALATPMTELADRLLAKRHKKVLKLGRHFERLSPEARHRLRIACKKLRYAAEFWRSLYKRKKAQAFVGALAGLQDDLGHLNDVATARSLLAGLGEARPDDAMLARGAGLVVAWHARGAAEAEPRLARDWRDFAESKPFWH